MEGNEKVVLREEEIGRALTRIAHEVIERNPRSIPAVVGIHRRGALLGNRLHALLECAAVLVHVGHRCLACLPGLRLIHQLGLLGGQCQFLRFEVRLRVRPLLLPLRLLGLRRLA